MRKKNIRRAAAALFVSQGDDKNKVLGSFIESKEVRQRVKDQGRALLILERLCLPEGKFSFTEEEMYSSLLKKLEKKGHRIQEDDEEDTEQFAQEKEQAKRERLAQVDNILGKTLDDLPPEEEKEAQEESCPCHKDEFGNVVEPVVECGTDLGDWPSPEIDYYKNRPDLLAIDTEYDLPDVAWQLIGQAYIDGIRTGRNSA